MKRREARVHLFLPSKTGIEDDLTVSTGTFVNTMNAFVSAAVSLP